MVNCRWHCFWNALQAWILLWGSGVINATSEDVGHSRTTLRCRRLRLTVTTRRDVNQRFKTWGWSPAGNSLIQRCLWLLWFLCFKNNRCISDLCFSWCVFAHTHTHTLAGVCLKVKHWWHRGEGVEGVEGGVEQWEVLCEEMNINTSSPLVFSQSPPVPALQPTLVRHTVKMSVVELLTITGGLVVLYHLLALAWKCWRGLRQFVFSKFWQVDLKAYGKWAGEEQNVFFYSSSVGAQIWIFGLNLYINIQQASSLHHDHRVNTL